MTKSANTPPGKGGGPPDPGDHEAFEKWLSKQPHEWSVTIAARAAARVLPLVRGVVIVLPVFRAIATARFAAKYPYRAIGASEVPDFPKTYFPGSRFTASVDNVSYLAPTVAVAAAYRAAGFAASGAGASAVAAAAEAAANAAYSGSAAVRFSTATYSAVEHDARRLHNGVLTAEQLARDQLWPISAPDDFGEWWQRLATELHAVGHHWRVWTNWYQNVVLHEPHRGITEGEDAAFTDIPGELPWGEGAEAVNTEIARRLADLRGEELSEIPDQSLAPVRVEERKRKISKVNDRESGLNATERDFTAWRNPVVDHIDELTASDFAIGTNHSRIRDRLIALGKLLPGEIAEVKERQFRIGYEIERFEGLMAAYRSGGEDMPALNAAQLEDLDRLRVALEMGIAKLERWSEFRRQANWSTAGEADADRETVGDALDEMAAVMEQHPKYFDPELPATFRFLSEAVRDPRGATKTVVYGAIKSAENVFSFLGQRALGIGKKGAEAVETHISKAVAASLVAGLSGAALGLSGALSQGWAWLKPLLAALGVGG